MVSKERKRVMLNAKDFFFLFFFFYDVMLLSVYLNAGSNNDWGYEMLMWPTEPQLSPFDQRVQLMESGLSGVIIESDHPYEDNTNKTFEVFVPNAEAVEIIFSAETSTEQNYDYIQFLKSEDGAEQYGMRKYSGGRGSTTKTFPGLGAPPLTIPSSRFWVRFVSDGEFLV